MLIQRIDPQEAAVLIAELDAYQNALYPAGSNHLESIAELQRPNVIMVGCFVEGQPAGIGAVKIMGDYGEIKRMYVLPGYRGQGIAQEILAYLEGEIRKAGKEYGRLETGVRQTAALSLYEKCGYIPRPPFGPYKEDPHSVFMEKRLSPKAAHKSI